MYFTFCYLSEQKPCNFPVRDGSYRLLPKPLANSCLHDNKINCFPQPFSVTACVNQTPFWDDLSTTVAA